MIPFKHRFCFFVCCYLLSYHISFGQCEPENFQPQFIYSDTTLSTSLIIEDADIDDLSNPGQGVCGVNINFRHNNVRELIIRLISPSGQTIDLIGPIATTATNTNNSSWDIKFLPCSMTPVPDDPFSSVFTNEDGWFQLRNFTGSYHPNFGCLEDFNSGPVNGLWSIEVFSDSRFYEGEVLSFSLEFCDNNFTCNQCVADPGSFATIDLETEYCRGDESLLFDFSTLFDPQVDYVSDFYVIQGDEILDIQTTPDLRMYEEGEYHICGLSYFERQAAELPTSTSFSTLNDLFNSANSPICAKFSEECFTLNILNYADTLTIDTTICLGADFNFNGEVFNAAGEYRIDVGSDQCDTLIIINLETIELEALIANDSDLLTCTNETIALSVESSILTPNTSVLWKTADGSIQGDVSSNEVLATQRGRYWLILEEGGCQDSFSINIDVDTDLPLLSIAEPDTLSCKTASVELLLNSEPAAISYDWSGPDGFNSTEQNPRVVIPGIYTVEVGLPTGCTARISEEVQGDFVDPVFDIDISNITCVNSIGEVEIIDAQYQYFFEYPDGELNWDTGKIEYQQAGNYTITGKSIINGCTTDTMFMIQSDTREPSLSFDPVENIDCENLSIDLTVNSDIPINSYSWVGPDGPLPEDSNTLSTSQPGRYVVEVIGENGCENSIQEEVMSLNDDVPTLSLSADTIDCNTTSVRINVVVNVGGLSYSWYNDSGFSSSEVEPMVSDPGKYYLEAAVSANCIILDSIIIEEDLSEPSLSTRANNITCANVETQLIINDQQSNLNYQWFDPFGNSLVGNQPVVQEVGDYNLQAKGSNGCTASLFQPVGIDTVSPSAFASAPSSIMCDIQQLSLTGEGSSEGANYIYSWSTSDGSIIARANTLEPLVGSAGNYNLIVTDTNNGCEGTAVVEVQTATSDLTDFSFDQFDPPCSGTSTGYIDVGLIEGGTAPYSYSIDGSSYQVETLFDNLPAGNYKLNVKDRLGCGASKEVVLQDGLDVEVELEDDYEVNLGDEIEIIGTVITNGDPLRSIEWNLSDQPISSGQEAVNITPLTDAFIEVQIVTESGCEATTSALIKVTKDKDIYVPNAFNATGFDENSVFKIFATNAIQEVQSINIYDRWGNEVFGVGPYDPKIETSEWDGTHKSQNLIPGVYVYVVEVLLIDGEQRRISGDVLLIR